MTPSSIQALVAALKRKEGPVSLDDATLKPTSQKPPSASLDAAEAMLDEPDMDKEDKSTQYSEDSAPTDADTNAAIVDALQADYPDIFEKLLMAVAPSDEDEPLDAME